MLIQEVKSIIEAKFRTRDNLSAIGLDDDYFDCGVSSLTIIGLQIDVERALGVNIETRELMGLSTISQWIDIYTDKLSALALTPQEGNHGCSQG